MAGNSKLYSLLSLAWQLAFYDPTQPAARAYVWSQLKKNYYDYGIKIWWLDAAEPETFGGDPSPRVYSLGPDYQVGMGLLCCPLFDGSGSGWGFDWAVNLALCFGRCLGSRVLNELDRID